MAADEKATLPALAAAVATWFPELEGRAVAVSEVDVFTADNLPSLPVVFVALAKELADDPYKSKGRVVVHDDIVVEFMQRPERYRLADGFSESPFWAYYDYERVRDHLVVHTRNWRSPRGGLLEYRGMDFEVDDFSVTLTFRFFHHVELCPADMQTVPALACEAPRLSFTMIPAAILPTPPA